MLLGRNKWFLGKLTEEKVLESHPRKKNQMKWGDWEETGGPRLPGQSWKASLHRRHPSWALYDVEGQSWKVMGDKCSRQSKQPGKRGNNGLASTFQDLEEVSSDLSRKQKKGSKDQRGRQGPVTKASWATIAGPGFCPNLNTSSWNHAPNWRPCPLRAMSGLSHMGSCLTPGLESKPVHRLSMDTQ